MMSKAPTSCSIGDGYLLLSLIGNWRPWDVAPSTWPIFSAGASLCTIAGMPGTAWYGCITLCFSKAASSVTRCNIAESTVVSPAASGRSTSRGAWIHPSLQLDPDAFWNVIFPSYASALNELNVADLCAERFT